MRACSFLRGPRIRERVAVEHAEALVTVKSGSVKFHGAPQHHPLPAPPPFCGGSEPGSTSARMRVSSSKFIPVAEADEQTLINASFLTYVYIYYSIFPVSSFQDY